MGGGVAFILAVVKVDGAELLGEIAHEEKLAKAS